MKAITSWLLHLVPLYAIRWHLLAQGWQRRAHPNQRISVYTNSTHHNDDGSQIEIVLPVAQTREWPSYRKEVVTLLAIIENRGEAEIVADLLDFDVAKMSARFDTANTEQNKEE